jgi:hypothetical protein
MVSRAKTSIRQIAIGVTALAALGGTAVIALVFG